jgi:hypothetical protein
MHLVKGYSSSRHVASPDAAFLTNHQTLVVTVGRYPAGDERWASWYDTEGVHRLFDDERITAAYTLMPTADERDEPFVHLHYLAEAFDGQGSVASAYNHGPGAQPSILYRGTYVPQHAGRPRYHV